MRVLATGAAGFIGASLCRRLLDRGDVVFGIDNLNDYYDVRLKQDRLALLQAFSNFRFAHHDVASRPEMETLFGSGEFDTVVHLAAQAGVRHSIDHPGQYVDSNLVGFANILEGCRRGDVGHLVYASSSSVYGLNTREPFREDGPADHPVSLYGATKKANEAMAHAYAHLYGLAATGLRFFTVYGPWGRPDMAFFMFMRLMLEGRKIPVFNQGNMARDFTYIDDVVEGVIGAIDNPAKPDDGFDPARPSAASSTAPHRIYNLGSGNRIPLMDYIHAIEDALGIQADCEFLPMQAGDVVSTRADISRVAEWLGYRPKTDIQTGIGRFVKWYRDYYGV
ncbi:MAG: NAD-dependent epimerase [Gammaproteobacteria bacterium]|nr:NAD-dependent epimerase [Gammaproteobacteria bacterium]MYJ52857.1 NAD-dependent epimerase [Gammaproteobacteria bacterium]